MIGGVVFADRDADGTMPTQDEVRTITDIRSENGQMIVGFDDPLIYDHSGPVDPRTGEELTGNVGNLTRNVTFSSAAAERDGDGLVDRGVSLGEDLGPTDHYVTERGHIMFMHNDDVSVHDIAIRGLGRTDKSLLVDEVQTGGQHDAPLHQINGDAKVYRGGSGHRPSDAGRRNPEPSRPLCAASPHGERRRNTTITTTTTTICRAV